MKILFENQYFLTTLLYPVISSMYRNECYAIVFMNWFRKVLHKKKN